MATILRSAPRERRIAVSGGWIAFAVLSLVAVATRGIWFGDPVADFDEQLYSLIGWRMTQGDLPYVDLWDRKPLGLFLIFAFAHALFGPEPIAYQILALFSALGGAWLVYLLSLKLVDRSSATVAGALYLMLIAAYGSHSGQSEVFHTPLMLLMLWLVLDWQRPDATGRALAAMLVGGLALQVKYTVLPQCVFFGLWALYGRWRAGTSVPELVLLAAAFAALGVLPTAAVGVWFAMKGEFSAFWFANFISFFDRAPSALGRLPPSHLAAIVPLATVALSGIYAAFRLNRPRNPRVYAVYGSWALASLATIVLPATTYIHYYCALAAPAVLIALPLIDRRAPAKWLPAAALIAGMLWILDLPVRHESSQAERLAVTRLSGAIAPFVGTDRDCLYAFDGPTALYRIAATCLPTRFIYPDHLNNALEGHALGIAQDVEVRRILAARPGAIVTANAPVTVQCDACRAAVDQAIRRDYRPLITISLHTRAITAWARRDLSR